MNHSHTQCQTYVLPSPRTAIHSFVVWLVIWCAACSFQLRLRCHTSASEQSVLRTLPAGSVLLSGGIGSNQTGSVKPARLKRTSNQQHHSNCSRKDLYQTPVATSLSHALFAGATLFSNAAIFAEVYTILYVPCFRTNLMCLSPQKYI